MARADAGAPRGAPLPDRLLWLWQCRLHFWSFRRVQGAAGRLPPVWLQSCHAAATCKGTFPTPHQRRAPADACPHPPRAPRRLLAVAAAACSAALALAEATIAGALPNLSVVSYSLHATAGGWVG